MKAIRIVLAVQPAMLREALGQQIEQIDDAEVVGEAVGPIDLLIAVGQTEANVVIHSWPDAQVPEICSHLFAEYPGLLVIAIPSDEDVAYSCRQVVTTTPLRATSLDDMFSAIRRELADG